MQKSQKVLCRIILKYGIVQNKQKHCLKIGGVVDVKIYEFGKKRDTHTCIFEPVLYCDDTLSGDDIYDDARDSWDH